MSSTSFATSRDSLEARRDLAAFRVKHLGLVAHAGANAIENADSVAGIAAVSAQVHVGGVGPDHRNRLQLGQIERQQVLLVLQQHKNDLLGRFSRAAMLGAVGDRSA
jgi:hypothetical protein